MNVTDEQAQAAFDFLNDRGAEAAAKKAKYSYLKEYRKSAKAKAAKRSSAKSAALAEIEAYADDEYIAHLEALRIAEADWEWIHWMMESSKITLEVWRTTQANNRGKDNAR